MMATSVSADASGARVEFRPGASRQLFDAQVLTRAPNPLWFYDVTADGTRFLVASSVQSSATLNVVVNWDAELKK
jgi:hypothetical protein